MGIFTLKYDELTIGYYIVENNVDNLTIYKITDCNSNNCNAISLHIGFEKNYGDKDIVKITANKFSSIWPGVQWIRPVNKKAAKIQIIRELFRTNSTFKFDLDSKYFEQFLKGL
jgi:hypothetical protein